MPADTADDRRAVRRFVLIAVILPVVIVLSGLGAVLAALPTLPDPVATHWGPDGAPDGFGPVWLPLVLLAVSGLALPLLLALLTLPALRRGDRGFAYPFLGASALGLSAFLTVLIAVSTLRQAGVADAIDGPAIWMPVAVALPAGIGAGLAGWFLQPRRRFAPTTVPPTAPATLVPGEQVLWRQRVTIARSGAIVLSSAGALMAVITVVTAVATTDVLALWITAGATALVVLAVATNTVFHVQVDEEALTVTSAAGWPRVRVPMEDVATAVAVHVEPMGEFGGWGMRWAPPGRFGIVLRAGEGIEVRRRSGKTVTVTVDDAGTGAALLNALASRR